MNRERILITLGILVLLSPWSGLPLAWLEWILPIFGVVVMILAFTARRPDPAPRVQEVVHAQIEEPEPLPSRTVFS